MDTEPKRHWSRQWDIWASLLTAMLFLAQVLYFFTPISVIRIAMITVGCTLVSCGMLNLLSKK